MRYQKDGRIKERSKELFGTSLRISDGKAQYFVDYRQLMDGIVKMNGELSFLEVNDCFYCLHAD
jgi:hypothetical protein